MENIHSYNDCRDCIIFLPAWQAGEQKVRKTVILGVLLMLAVAADIGVNISEIHHQQELFELQKVIDGVQDERIKVLEKEVRILKTDMSIIQNGETDEEADNSR